MAFRDMVGGDCTGSNSMLKYVNHLNTDRSLQREGIPNERFEQQQGPSQSLGEDPYVNEFFAQRNRGEEERAFQFKELGHELDNVRLQEHHHHPGDWAQEFQGAGPSNWGNEFQDFHPQFEHDSHFEQIYRPPQAAMWAQEYQLNQQHYQIDPAQFEEYEKVYLETSKEKNKVVELPQDWTEEFENEQKEENLNNLEEIWNNVNEDELNFDDELDLYNENVWGDYSPTVEDKDYAFEDENPFLTHPNPYEEGLTLMENGNLSDAALAFEACVQKDRNHVDGWLRLGMVQQENEKELPAIYALREAVKLDPRNINSTLAIAVSYTNEGAESQALDALENWIHTKYPDFTFSESGGRTRQERVVDMYIDVVRGSGEIDADVQVGLGVLFNLSSEFEKAIDCFHTALQIRPDDYILWNRLGATLANGGKSEDAIQAYYKALQLKPSFVRARYNLGVSCLNIGCYKEAAEHFLSALTLHGTNSQKNASNNLWDTLRRCFLIMDRRDLFDKTIPRDVELFRGDFQF